MNPPLSRFRAFPFILAAASLMAGCATADNPQAAAPPPADAAAVKGTLPVLKIGATAEEIVRMIGKPLDVKPMAVQGGKAETWTYRRVLDQQTKQVAEASRGAAIIEPAHGIVSAGEEMPETEYHTVYVTTYQVTSLLMFNGKLAASKQRVETTESINN
jgi:hypothetical protein